MQGTAHDGEYNITENTAGSWMAVDLKRRLVPTRYCLWSDKHQSSLKLRS